jgi:lipopolysaccharide transport system ATP-binding protein
MISVRLLGKRYHVAEREAKRSGRGGAGGPARLSEVIVEAGRRLICRIGGGKVGDHRDDFWALRGVSFSVSKGEVIGIVGRNGAGKSTLLKVLSQITPPTEGSFRIEGRVASLLEVGAGFHSELTGRENVYLYGAIIGMSRREISAKFDEIVAFAGVERFLDTPVKRYSSGMHVRLAFAVAAHFDSEVLILDEVFAVGDLSFRNKCFSQIGRSTDLGRTVLVVSHNLALIQNLCSRVLVLDGGQLVFDGPTESGVAKYLSAMDARTSDAVLPALESRPGSGRVRVANCGVEDGSGSPVSVIAAGSQWQVRIAYCADEDGQNLPLCAQVRICDLFGTPLFMHHSDLAGATTQSVCFGEFVWKCQRMQLQPGRYRIHVVLRFPSELLDQVEDALAFDVVEGDFFGGGRLYPVEFGKVLVEGDWSHTSTPLRSDL